MRIIGGRGQNLLSLFVSARILLCSSVRLQARGLSMAGFDANRFRSLQIGLTGSIGMGKSTLTKHLIKLGIPVFDADHQVHKLYDHNGDAVEPIQSAFPDVIHNGVVDRTKLSAKIMKDPTVLKEIEAIVHPLVHAERQKFYERACADKRFMVVYDIPLLFESTTKYELDYTIVASAGEETQRKRVLERHGMTDEKFTAILAKQVPDAVKREKADFVVNTDYVGYSEAKAQLAKVLETIIERHPQLWEHWKTSVPSRGPRHALDDTKLTSLSPAARRVLENVDVALFDLDDTLVPVLAQLNKATAAAKEFMAVHMPQTNAVVDAKLRSTMKSIALNQPLVAHDLSGVRRLALLELATPFPEEVKYVHQAAEVFFNARSDVSENFYSDATACLEWFHSLGIKVGVLTNGSAELHKCDFLKNILSVTFTAADIGASKPSPVGFMACAQVLDVAPSRILYIGDSYECDVLGANNAGMISALLLRRDFNNKAELQDGDVYTAEDLAEQKREAYHEAQVMLPSLRVKDLETYLGKFFEERTASP